MRHMRLPRMRFRPGDDESAQRTITELNARFDTWYRTRYPEEEVIDTYELGLLVDWKLGYGDGRPDEWTIDQLEEFLLEWCPRKVSVSAAHAARMPEGVAQAFTFLADQGLLARRSVHGDRLAAHARSLVDAFVNEMTEPANFGPAKSIFGGAAFTSLAEYYRAPGRPLTAKGNIRLARWCPGSPRSPSSRMRTRSPLPVRWAWTVRARTSST